MSDPLRLLFVEDSSEDADLAQRELRNAGLVFTAQRVETAADCLKALRDGPPDAVLADFTLPELDALAVIEMVKAEAPGTPVLVITGTIGEETAVACIRAGASDYLLKDRLGRLAPALQSALQTRRTESGRRLLATAVEQAAESIVITDRLGAIEWVNPAFEAVTGFSRQEAIGQNPRILKGGRQDAAFYEEMWRVLADGDVWRGHFVNRRKDGTLFEEDATISPVRDPSGVTTHYVAVKRDVTHELALQRQLELSQRIEALGRLAGGIAHDFNNLLGIVRGFAEFHLRYPGKKQELASSLQEIVKAADRGAKLTSQLLAFGRKQVLQPQVVDLRAALADVTGMFRHVLGEDVVLDVRVPAPLHVRVDPTRLEQILLNLVVNARDAMSSGGRLTIEAGPAVAVEDGLRCARLSVADTGAGMSPETLERIFEPFFTTKPNGTGLGLSMVYGIVRQSGGAIRCESAPGQGARFEIILPLADPPGTPGTPATSTLRPASRGKGHETILLVEDQGVLREILARGLTAEGFTILEAGDGHGALKVAQAAGPIDLLLTDVVMPGLSGRELAERLSASRPGLRTLFMTGHGMDVLAPHGVLEQGVRIVEKPFRMEALLDAVFDALSEGSPGTVRT